MVYTRLLFNNIKEFTPNFMKTVPYNKCVRPQLGRKPQVGWKAFKDPRTIRLMRIFKRYIIDDSAYYQLFFFGVVFTMTSVFFFPALWVYQSNNRHRQLSAAVQRERAYKKRKAEEEAEADEE